MTETDDRPETTPAEAALAADLTSMAFELGVSRHWWRLVEHEGSNLTVVIVAETGVQLALRVDCSGYPSVPPAGAMWSIEDDALLPPKQFPQGGPRANAVFSTGWSPSHGNAPYFPYDRRAIEGHDPWRTQYPDTVWDAQHTITDYLAELRRILASATGPAAEGPS